MQSQFQQLAFTVIKLEPSDIILQQNTTRKLYRYLQTPTPPTPTPEPPSSPLILPCQKLLYGYIHEKEQTTLHQVLQSRITAQHKHYFTEVELNNTFQPILQLLQSGQYYSGISLQGILVDARGEIRLRDPRVNVGKGSAKGSEFFRLGLIVLQCAMLESQERVWEMDKSMESLVKKLANFSNKFIANILILLNPSLSKLATQIELSQSEPTQIQYKQIISEVMKHRNNSTVTIPSPKQIFKSIQEKKVIVIPPLNLKFNRAKKPDLKINLGRSKRHNQNENDIENEESVSKRLRKGEKVERGPSPKPKVDRVLEEKTKAKAVRKEFASYESSTIKKKGKTLDKAKFQERKN